MAKLTQFKQDARAIQEGEWVRVGEEYDDLEIKTRGFTDAYYDAQAQRQRSAAKAVGSDVSRLPIKTRREINVECMIRHMLLDVRNLHHEDGKPVTFAEFCDFLRDASYADLGTAAFAAAERVGKRRAADLEDAVGNSPTASAGS